MRAPALIRRNLPGVIDAAPVFSLLPGKRHRKRVVTPQEESAYFDKTPEPLRFIAIVLADTGLRPEECYRMRWEELNWNNGRFGTILIKAGWAQFWAHSENSQDFGQERTAATY